ncbi:MAG TPA: hypothetical protein VGD78_00260 [Chthoniobacterales bacterium]
MHVPNYPRESARAMHAPDSLSRLIALGALCFFASFPLILILKNGVRVPYGDEYALGPLLEAVRSGRASLETFWIPHNEHRIMFPRLVFCILVTLTRWNSVDIMIASWVVMTGAGLFLLHGLARIFDEARPRLWLLTVIASFSLFYSAIQKENWLWAFQLTFFLVQFGVILGTFCMSFTRVRTTPRIAVAVLFAVLATGSTATGLMAWPALIVTLLLSNETKVRKLAGALTLLVLMAGVGLAYFHAYRMPAGGHTDVHAMLRKPKLLAYFFLELLGAPLTYGLPDELTAKPNAAFIAGAILLLLFLALSWIVIRSGQRAKAAPWIGLAFFGMGFCAITTYGRAGFGVSTASYISRYTTHAVLFTISVLVLGYLSLSGRKRLMNRAEWSIAGALSGGFGVLVAMGYLQAFHAAPLEQAPRLLAKKLLPFLPYIDPQTDGSPTGPFFALCPAPHFHLYESGLKPYRDLGYLRTVNNARFNASPAGLQGGYSISQVKGGAFPSVELTGQIHADPMASLKFVFFKMEGQDKFLAATTLDPEPANAGKHAFDWHLALAPELLASGKRLQIWAYDRALNAFLEVQPEPVLDEGMITIAECSIDAVNGLPVATQPIEAGGPLFVQGWATVCGEKGMGNDGVFVVMIGSDGKFLRGIRARAVPRPDVDAYFKHPEMGTVGFEAVLDTTNLKGNGKLQIYVERQKLLLPCPSMVGIRSR